jgi:hypothetical protein
MGENRARLGMGCLQGKLSFGHGGRNEAQMRRDCMIVQVGTSGEDLKKSRDHRKRNTHAGAAFHSRPPFSFAEGTEQADSEGLTALCMPPRTRSRGIGCRFYTTFIILLPAKSHSRKTFENVPSQPGRRLVLTISSVSLTGDTPFARAPSSVVCLLRVGQSGCHVFCNRVPTPSRSQAPFKTAVPTPLVPTHPPRPFSSTKWILQSLCQALQAGRCSAPGGQHPLCSRLIHLFTVPRRARAYTDG